MIYNKEKELNHIMQRNCRKKHKNFTAHRFPLCTDQIYLDSNIWGKKDMAELLHIGAL